MPHTSTTWTRHDEHRATASKCSEDEYVKNYIIPASELGYITGVNRIDPDAPLVVKRTTVDLARDRWYDRLHGQGGRSPARREYENLVGLAAAGLPVPQPLGWAEDGARGLLVMERVPHGAHLRDRLLAGAEPSRWREDLVGHVATMHRSGRCPQVRGYTLPQFLPSRPFRIVCLPELPLRHFISKHPLKPASPTQTNSFPPEGSGSPRRPPASFSSYA